MNSTRGNVRVSAGPAPGRLPNPIRIAEQSWPGGTVPVVSIVCVTYNHERFIRQCLEGFLMQETTFHVEIIIHDDASTDQTAEIIRAYDAKHPGVFHAILQTENQMQAGKRITPPLFNAARGEYIAICEGDDYWTSPHKLQRQVTILDKHPNAAFCFHNTLVVFEEDPGSNHLAHPKPLSDVTIYDILSRWFIMTSSIVLRRQFLLPLPSWSIEINQRDWMLQMLLAARGPVSYTNEVMSVYRRHAGGISNKYADPDVFMEDAVLLYRCFNLWSKGKYREPVFHQLALFYFHSAMRRRLRGEYARFMHDALLHFRFSRLSNLIGLATSARQLLFPRSWNEFLTGTRAFKFWRRIYRRSEGDPSRYL